MAMDATALTFLLYSVLTLSISSSRVCASRSSGGRDTTSAVPSCFPNSCIVTNKTCFQDYKPPCLRGDLDEMLPRCNSSRPCYQSKYSVNHDCEAEDIALKYLAENNSTYTLQVSWRTRYPEEGLCGGQGLQGYRVELYEGTSRTPDACTCRSIGSMVVNFTGLLFVKSEKIEVRITPYPSNIHTPNSSVHTKRFSAEAPEYCYDPRLVQDNSLEVLAEKCGYPRYNSPDITVVTAYLNVSTQSPMTEVGSNSTLLQAEVSWTQQKPADCFNCPDPAAYYVSLYHCSSTDGNCYGPEQMWVFKVTNATSIIITPLESDKKYSVSINSYVPCTLSTNSDVDFEQCSISSSREDIPKPVVLTSSPHPTTSTIIQMSTMPSIQISTTSGPISGMDEAMEPRRTILIEVIVPTCSAVGIFMLALPIVIAGVVIHRRRRRYQRLPTVLPPDTPTVTRTPICPSHQGCDFSCLLVFSPYSSEQHQQVIYEWLVQGFCRFGITAKCYDPGDRKPMAYWLEEQRKRVNAVLFVCNEAFYKDWNSNDNSRQSVVLAMKSLLPAMLEHDRELSNCAIVLLKESHQSRYIPTDYLLPKTRFLVNQTEEIGLFIKRLPSFVTMEP